MPAASVETLLLGAVAYDPKVVTIWEGFKDYFNRRGLPFDFVLYSNYERQVEAHLAGHVHIAWNSPLAWVRARRCAAAQGRTVQALVMRDSDCDLASVIVVRADSPLQTATALKGKVVAVGATDSPQATLLPLGYLQAQGLEPNADFQVRYHNVLVGKHGDHVGGERAAAQALASRQADAACLLESNYQAFMADGTLPSGSTRVLARTPIFDHCNFTVTGDAPAPLVERFRELLLAMSYDDPEVRPLFDMEGLKAWKAGRTEGYAALETAASALKFYDAAGVPSASV